LQNIARGSHAIRHVVTLRDYPVPTEKQSEGDDVDVTDAEANPPAGAGSFKAADISAGGRDLLAVSIWTGMFLLFILGLLLDDCGREITVIDYIIIGLPQSLLILFILAMLVLAPFVWIWRKIQGWLRT
jgi:hypothetical protein